MSLLEGLSILDSDVHMCRVQGALRGNKNVGIARRATLASPMARHLVEVVWRSPTHSLGATCVTKRRATYLAGVGGGSISSLS